MARNRKRAKERRARRPESVAAAQARRQRSAPSPIGHAAPDVELAEAQLEVGRSDGAEEQDDRSGLVDETDDRSGVADETEDRSEVMDEVDDDPGVVDGAAEEATEDEFGEFDSEESSEVERTGRSTRRGVAPSRDGEALTVATGGVPEHRPWVGGRFLHFLQGSWRELQRVQWPDRRQVMQATGVVIGFVIIAGLFLGGADWVAGKITDFILK